MERIACKECTSPDCHGCNMYRLERMLMSGKLDALMDENRAIKMDADVRPVERGKWKRVVDFTGVEAFGFKETMVVGWGCNVCGYEVDASEESFNFCPNCGADMRGESDV